MSRPHADRCDHDIALLRVEREDDAEHLARLRMLARVWPYPSLRQPEDKEINSKFLHKSGFTQREIILYNK